MLTRYFRQMLLFIAFTSAGVSYSQNKKLTLEDIYSNNLYRAKGFGPIRWMKDNNMMWPLAQRKSWLVLPN